MSEFGTSATCQLHRAPAHPWTLEELAAEAHVSRATLVRIFRREGDLPPLGFLSELRLGLARQRLSPTNATLAQVAAAVGYDAESAFSRVSETLRDFARKTPRHHNGRSRGENSPDSMMAERSVRLTARP
jgi:AraC family transcriptional activator of mtrCDE